MKKAISVLLSTAMLTASLSPTAAAVDLKLLSNPDVITAMAEETGAAAADAVVFGIRYAAATAAAAVVFGAFCRCRRLFVCRRRGVRRGIAGRRGVWY
jgi:hypothetical protein